MRKISAQYIFPVTSKPLKQGVLEIDDDGKINKIIDTGGKLGEISGLEFYNGIIVPGFVNTHCHLELSDLRNKIPEKTGLPGFVGQVQKIRNSLPENTAKAIMQADKEMQVQGIVAVGDISNTALSFPVKESSPIKYYNFLEVYGINPSDADKIIEKANQLNNLTFLPGAIVPHAPYSVSAALLNLINQQTYKGNTVLSIHNQETQSEDEMFRMGTGEMKEHLEKMGVDLSAWKATGFSSLQSTLVHLAKCHRILLVHNTFTSKDDVNWLKNYFFPPENGMVRLLEQKMLYFAFCPNANLFIEGRLPDIPLLINSGIKPTLGTDSLASNHQLSILEEMKTIQQQFPELSIETLIQWGCLNGAEALGFDKQLGSFDPGKCPGVNLIENVDFEKMHFTINSVVKKLL